MALFGALPKMALFVALPKRALFGSLPSPVQSSPARGLGVAPLAAPATSWRAHTAALARAGYRRVSGQPALRGVEGPSHVRTGQTGAAQAGLPPGLAEARGRSGRGAPNSSAPGWGAGRCKISVALNLQNLQYCSWIHTRVNGESIWF